MAQQLTEKEIAGDILSGFKLNAAGYLQAVLEAQDPSIRQAFVDYQNQCLASQEKIFRSVSYTHLDVYKRQLHRETAVDLQLADWTGLCRRGQREDGPRRNTGY